MAMNLESGVTLRRDLTAVANEYADELAQQGFIGLRAAPMTGVGEQAATYPVISRENFLKVDETQRKADGAYNRIDGQLGSRSYECLDHGLETLLDDSRSKRYATFLDFETAMTRILMYRILLAHERRVAAMVIDATTYTAHACATAWSTAATAVPLTDIETGVGVLNKATGFPPEAMSLILSYTDMLNMCRTANVIAQVQYTFSGNEGVRPAILKAGHIATVLGIKEVLVGRSAYDTKEEGIAPSVSGVWTSGYAMLAVLGAAESELEMPAAWRTLLWTEDSPELPVVERYRSDERRGDVIRVRHNTAEVACAEADLMAYLIQTT